MAVIADLNKLFSTFTSASQTQASFGLKFAKSFESILGSVKTLNMASGPNSFLATVKELANTQQLQKGLDTFSSSILARSELMGATLEAAFKGGGPTDTAVKAMETLGRLDFSQTMSGLIEGAKYATKLSEALGTSAENSAQLVFYAKQAGVPLSEMGDTLATIRDNTRLTADEFGRFSTELGTALMTLGDIKDISVVLKESLRIDDALRKFTGSSGDYVKFFQHIAQSSEGLQTAMSLGFSPEDLGKEGAQKQFVQNLGQFVDRLTRGQPLLQQLAVLEQLSQQTGLSVVSLRSLSKATQDLQNNTNRQVTLDERYAEQIANLSKATQSIRDSFNQLISVTLLPLVTVTTYAAKGLAYILEQLREMPGIFTTLAIAGIIPAVLAVRGLISVIRTIAVAVPFVITSLMSFNRAIQRVGVSAALASTGVGKTGGGLLGTGSFQTTLLPQAIRTPLNLATQTATQTATQVASMSVFQKLTAPLFGKLTTASLSSSISAAYIVETLKGGFASLTQGFRTIFASGTFIQTIRGGFTGLMQGFRTIFTSGTLIETLKSGFTGLLQGFRTIFASGTFIQTIRGGFTGLLQGGFMQGIRTLFTGGTSLIGSSLTSVIVNPLKLLFTSVWGPISRALLWLASPVGLAGLAVAAAAATAVWLVKKDIDLIRETRKIEAYNKEGGLRMAQQLRSDVVDKSARARKAQVSEGATDEDTLKSINITQRKLVDGHMIEQTYSLAKLMENQQQELERLKQGGSEEGALTDLEAAKTGKELAERNVVLLRNAIASTQNLLLTESQPASEAEQKNLELLERMVKTLEKQVAQKDREIEEAATREEDLKSAEVREAVRQQSYRVLRTGF